MPPKKKGGRRSAAGRSNVTIKVTAGKGILSDLAKKLGRVVLPYASQGISRLTGSSTAGKVAEALGDAGLKVVGGRIVPRGRTTAGGSFRAAGAGVRRRH